MNRIKYRIVDCPHLRHLEQELQRKHSILIPQYYEFLGEIELVGKQEPSILPIIELKDNIRGQLDLIEELLQDLRGTTTKKEETKNECK